MICDKGSRVQVFQLDGTFLHQWESSNGLSRDLYQVLVSKEYTRHVQVFQLDGTLVCSWRFPDDDPKTLPSGPAGLAVTRTGQVLVYDKHNHKVLVLE